MAVLLSFFSKDARLPTVNTIFVPEGYDWKEITEYIMKNHEIEVSGGLGPLAGKVNTGSWRENSESDVVAWFLKNAL